MATNATMTVEEPAAIAAGRAAFRADGPGGAAAARLRQQGLDRFTALGLPTRRTEAWRYTDLRDVARTAWTLAPAAVDPAQAAPWLADTDADRRLVLVNGRFRPDLSTPDLPGVTATPLDGLLADGDGAAAAVLDEALTSGERPFLALNTAFLDGGLVVRLAPGATVGRLEIVCLTLPGGDAPAMSHPRLIIEAGDGADATLVERHVGPAGPILTTPVLQITVGAGARLGHYKLQREGGETSHLATVLVQVARDAVYDGFMLSTGGAVARTEVAAVLTGRGGECRLSGTYLGRGRQVLDTTTVVRHAVPDCRSRQVIKGVLDDQARGVFQGRIEVARDAQRTDGYQMNRALLLSPQAEIDSKPELEIFADDVKCSHGATAGELDAEALFYLRSRGLDAERARALLIEAFVVEVLDEIADDAVRQHFTEIVTDWLAADRADHGATAERGAA